MSTSFLALHGHHSSIILEKADRGLPIWRHWGRRIETSSTLPSWDATVPVPSFSLDQNQPLRLLPLFGQGWFGRSAVGAHRAQLDWALAHLPCEIKATDSRIDTTLTDQDAGIQLIHTLEIDKASDTITQRTRLTNIGETPLDVSHLSAGALPLPSSSMCVESFSGRHNNEFQPLSDHLSRSGWSRDNRRGLTSHDCPPMARVLGHGSTQSTGEVWAAQLAWSGNHQQTIDWLDDGRWLWMSGEWLAPGEVRLNSGETLTSPDWLATYSPNGRDGAAQNFHKAIRVRNPLWQEGTLEPRPVHINTWEGFYFDHKETELFDLATSAAALGIERFVLDDGWFLGRDDDTSSLGDWQIDHTKYPRGLKPLVDHVLSLGMEFGLWFEPEMVNPDSDLYRRHPDWVLRLGSHPALTSRHQLVLDMSRLDVQDYLFACIDDLLSDLKIKYIKWDHNRDLTQAGSSGRPAYHQQIQATYKLIDRILEAHPDVEIEACAGGGGRIDAGILTRTHRVWTSDCIDAVSRQTIQAGFLGFFPPELMGSHIGASPAHSTGRSQSMAFRAATALTGHFGVELDPRSLTEVERQEMSDWIALYKSVRGVLHTGSVWQGSAGDGVVWQAFGAATDFILFVHRIDPTKQRFPPRLRLAFTEASAAYRIDRIDPNKGQYDAPPPEFLSVIEAGTASAHGSWLSELGLPLPYMKAERSLVFRFVA